MFPFFARLVKMKDNTARIAPMNTHCLAERYRTPYVRASNPVKRKQNIVSHGQLSCKIQSNGTPYVRDSNHVKYKQTLHRKSGTVIL